MALPTPICHPTWVLPTKADTAGNAASTSKCLR
jgi:hypothetical protein